LFNKAYYVSSGVPLSPDQPTTQTSKRKFGKKLYAAIAGIIAIAVIIAALLIPQGAATIPLEVNYTVGEKMVYNTTETMSQKIYNTTMTTLPTLNDLTINMTSTVEVVDFNGEYYTLNHTMTTMFSTSLKPISMSILENVSKTGYSTYILPGEAPQAPSNISSSPYLIELLNRPEVKVGDTWTVPLNIGNSSIGMTGDATMMFGGFEDLTVPAGTYKVFRVDMTSNNLAMHFSPSGSNSKFLTLHVLSLV
jgi:hypothetical protein